MAKFDHAIASELIEAVKYLPIIHACYRVGITNRTYNRWRLAGSKGIEPYVTFARLARMAEAEYAESLLKKIDAAGGKDWKAHAWILERRFPEIYAANADRIQAKAQQTPSRKSAVETFRNAFAAARTEDGV